MTVLIPSREMFMIIGPLAKIMSLYEIVQLIAIEYCSLRL
jgi:hypothetical protein